MTRRLVDDSLFLAVSLAAFNSAIEHPKGCGEKHIHMTEEQIERNEFLRTAKYSAIDYFA